MKRTLALSGLLALPGLATAGNLYSNDFNGGVTGSASIGMSNSSAIIDARGYRGVPGFEGDFLWNKSRGNPAGKTTFTFTGLGEHDTIDISFAFAAIDSWDGTTPVNKSYTPDLFNVEVDGVSVFSESFDNFGGYQSYQGEALVSREALFGRDHWKDSAYAIELTNIAHTSDTLTIALFAGGAGWQGGNDESWAIDNFSVSTHTTAVPLPAAGALAGAGLLGLGARRGRTSMH